MADEESSKAVWNMDDEVLKALLILKTQFLGFLRSWDLENSYWTIRLIDSEATPSFSEDKQEQVKTKFKELETIRQKWINNPVTEKSHFWSELNNLYKELNGIMINEGYYFRKRELYQGL